MSQINLWTRINGLVHVVGFHVLRGTLKNVSSITLLVVQFNSGQSWSLNDKITDHHTSVNIYLKKEILRGDQISKVKDKLSLPLLKEKQLK